MVLEARVFEKSEADKCLLIYKGRSVYEFIGNYINP